MEIEPTVGGNGNFSGYRGGLGKAGDLALADSLRDQAVGPGGVYAHPDIICLDHFQGMGVFAAWIGGERNCRLAAGGGTGQHGPGVGTMNGNNCLVGSLDIGKKTLVPSQEGNCFERRTKLHDFCRETW